MELLKLRLCCLFAHLFESFYPALEQEPCHGVMHDMCIKSVSITAVSSFYFPFWQAVEYAVNMCGCVWMVHCFVVVLHSCCFVALHSCSFDIVVWYSCVFVVFVPSCASVVARPVAHPVVVAVFFHSCSFVVFVVVDVNCDRCGFCWWIVDYFDVVIGRFPLNVDVVIVRFPLSVCYVGCVLLVLGVVFLGGVVVIVSLHSCGNVVSVCVVIDGFGYVVACSVLKN